jgi:hypothetical protein
MNRLIWNVKWRVSSSGHAAALAVFPSTISSREGTVVRGKRLLSNALRQYPIGLEETDNGLWSLYFCHVLLVGSMSEWAHSPGDKGVTHVPGMLCYLCPQLLTDLITKLGPPCLSCLKTPERRAPLQTKTRDAGQVGPLQSRQFLTIRATP